MDDRIGGHGKHGSPGRTGRIVWHASTSGATGISENAVVPNQAPPHVRLSTDVYPYNPDQIDVLIARIIGVSGWIGVHSPCVAFDAGNSGR